MSSLHRFLIDYDMAMLRALAQNRGVALSTSHQEKAADELSTALLQPLSVRTALALLSPEGRSALQNLLAVGGRMRAPQFARRFGQVRAIGPGRLERETLWQNPANAAEELWFAGLIFYAFSEDEYGVGEFVFVPDDLRALLPEPQIEPPAFTVEQALPPSVESSGEPAMVHDLFAHLVYLQNHDVRPYASGHLGRRDLASLRRRMLDADEGRLDFLQHLSDRLGLTARQGEYLRLESAPVKQWLTATLSCQVATLQEAWRDDPTWNDLCHVPSLVCDRQTPWQNDPVATRRALLPLLARCPMHDWWSLDSFVTAVHDFHPDFQRPSGDYTSWYIRDAVSEDYYSGFESWHHVEGALLAYLLNGPLYWLGIVETVAQADESLCRLTEAGARFLGLLSEETESAPSPPIVVSPDFCVDLPAPASLYVRFQLERFAELESQDPCRYRLTVSGLVRALSRDIRVEQVLAFLRQASDGPVPANVAGQLELWADRFGQVLLEEAVVLTVKNERVLKDLIVLPETRSLIKRTISPTSALVQKPDLPRLRKELRALGYLLPEETGDDSTELG
jgi:hypothetical protein